MNTTEKTHEVITLAYICGSDVFVRLARVLRIRDIIMLRSASRAIQTALAVHLVGMTVRSQHTDVDGKCQFIEIATTIPRINKRLVHQAENIDPRGERIDLVYESSDSTATIYESIACCGILSSHIINIYIYAVDGLAMHVLAYKPYVSGATSLFKSASPIPIGAMIGRITIHRHRINISNVDVRAEGLLEDSTTSAYIDKKYRGTHAFHELSFLRFIVNT